MNVLQRDDVLAPVPPLYQPRPSNELFAGVLPADRVVPMETLVNVQMHILAIQTYLSDLILDNRIYMFADVSYIKKRTNMRTNATAGPVKVLPVIGCSVFNHFKALAMQFVWHLNSNKFGDISTDYSACSKTVQNEMGVILDVLISENNAANEHTYTLFFRAVDS